MVGSRALGVFKPLLITAKLKFLGLEERGAILLVFYNDKLTNVKCFLWLFVYDFTDSMHETRAFTQSTAVVKMSL